MCTVLNDIHSDFLNTMASNVLICRIFLVSLFINQSAVFRLILLLYIWTVATRRGGGCEMSIYIEVKTRTSSAGNFCEYLCFPQFREYGTVATRYWIVFLLGCCCYFFAWKNTHRLEVMFECRKVYFSSIVLWINFIVCIWSSLLTLNFNFLGGTQFASPCGAL